MEVDPVKINKLCRHDIMINLLFEECYNKHGNLLRIVKKENVKKGLEKMVIEFC